MNRFDENFLFLFSTVFNVFETKPSFVMSCTSRTLYFYGSLLEFMGRELVRQSLFYMYFLACFRPFLYISFIVFFLAFAGNLSEVVVKSARFVQYFMVSSVLKLFKTIGSRASIRATTTTAHS